MTNEKPTETEGKAAVDLSRLVRRLRAYSVICGALHPVVKSVVRAETASKAKFKAWNSAREAGYEIGFVCFRVRRSPEYDSLEKLKRGQCYGEDYAVDCLRESQPNVLSAGTAVAAESVGSRVEVEL